MTAGINKATINVVKDIDTGKRSARTHKRSVFKVAAFPPSRIVGNLVAKISKLFSIWTVDLKPIVQNASRKCVFSKKDDSVTMLLNILEERTGGTQVTSAVAQTQMFLAVVVVVADVFTKTRQQ